LKRSEVKWILQYLDKEPDRVGCYRLRVSRNILLLEVKGVRTLMPHSWRRQCFWLYYFYVFIY